jgi:hypothetical protein
MAAEVKIK